MELVSQHVKGIMEECKLRARDQGLKFDDETLEYIVTNRDMVELSPKVMIPTLYDYWVHDVRVLSGKGMYEAYPSNPYETVINTRPAISFYNDNNPDWLNVMIFYHVLGHIDFFQNNLFYKNTWDIDLTGQALSDKRMIAQLRSEKGRWVDYAIEFSRGIDNLVGYQKELNHTIMNDTRLRPLLYRKLSKTDFYFDIFLQKIKNVSFHEYLKEITRFNTNSKGNEDFFGQVVSLYPEFEELYKKEAAIKIKPELDIVEYILQHSSFLKEDENNWIKSVIQIVKNTSLYFQPQIRTKIMNEGWASYWHEYLFMRDDRICGHEVDFAKVNANVTSMPKVGLNPYALGMRLFEHIKDMEDKGCYCFDYVLLKDEIKKKNYNQSKNSGDEFILKVRENFNDFTFINTFVDQEFVARHNLFVAGKRFNSSRISWEYYIKSKKAEDYKEMIVDTLYHPPEIFVDKAFTRDGILYLNHKFENKPLKMDFIENTMMGIEYLWGGPVYLETSEPEASGKAVTNYANFWDPVSPKTESKDIETVKWKRMVYVMENRKLSKKEV
ncbi:MAG: SpoVR family protein [Deltaproteobacteria bacterium]|uniref:SpoVR family protein n=1 Tax=Desulfobacula sp. TaxID=2593537 RepID=UPI0019877EC6|nr:SpoVR family protein [Candidatus Desulfobacula maris]MBL6992826.1 SpoVR family protein [Desulfobacula sp.]